MLKQAFTNGQQILLISRHESNGSIILNIGGFVEPTVSMEISSKEEFCALIGELYKMWDSAQAAKSA